MERKLAAILYADVAGYSRLTGADEEGTHRALGACLDALTEAIPKQRGRVCHTAGDALLAEFASVTGALKCAIETQRQFATRNADIPKDNRLQFRMGVNLGEVIVDRGEVYGDGVNVAARLESLAQPGGICISGRVFEQVTGKLDVGYAYLGQRFVKNIKTPINVYRVLLDPADAGRIVTPRNAYGALRQRWLVAAAFMIVVALAGGGLWWSRPWAPQFEPASIERMAHPLPDKPSIAVLPFTNMSDDPSQEYFADGMTEDLITDLSKISGLFVIARNSTFAYKGTSLDVRRAAEELGVRYVLEGSVRRVGDQVRINAQLIDATTGGHLWAERYDGSLNNVFALQDKVTRKIVTVLAVQLTSGEQEQFALRQTENAEAYDVFLKGWDQYLRQTPEGFRDAITYFEKAVELDPNYARAYAALAATYWQVQKRRWHAKLGYGSVHYPLFKAEEFLEKSKWQPTALSHQVAAAMFSQEGRHTEAIAEGGKAIGVDPNDADSYVALAGALSLAGNPEEALQLVKKAMRLNPHFPAFYLYELGLAQFGIGEFQQAAASLEKATTLNSEDRWSYRLLIATYGHLGRKADAERIFEVIEKNWRGYDPISIRAIAYWYPFKEAVDRERLATGLRKANVPD
jgi:TolB-like protein/class 3 adenylate cyclase/Flp pilus assembly protein TadD